MSGSRLAAAMVCGSILAACAVPSIEIGGGLPEVAIDVQPMAEAPIPDRVGATAVWTGSEAIYWGGRSGDKTGDDHGDGAAYNPGTDIWRPIPEPTEDVIGTPRDVPALSNNAAVSVAGNVFFPTANFALMLEPEDGVWKRVEVSLPDYEVRYGNSRFVAHDDAVYLLTRGWNEVEGGVVIVATIHPESGEVVDVDISRGPDDWPVMVSTPNGLALLLADDEQNSALVKQGDNWVDGGELSDGLLRETQQEADMPTLVSKNRLVLPSTFQLYLVDLSTFETTAAPIDLETDCALGSSTLVANHWLIAWNGTGCIVVGDDGVEKEVSGGVVITLP